MISQIGAFRLEHPDKEVDYERLFGSYHHRLKEDYYDQKKSQTTKFQEIFFKLVEDDTQDIDDKDLHKVEQMRARLRNLGYTDESAKHSLAFLLNKQSGS